MLLVVLDQYSMSILVSDCHLHGTLWLVVVSCAIEAVDVLPYVFYDTAHMAVVLSSGNSNSWHASIAATRNVLSLGARSVPQYVLHSLAPAIVQSTCQSFGEI